MDGEEGVSCLAILACCNCIFKRIFVNVSSFLRLSNAHNHTFIIAAIDSQKFYSVICTTELIRI